MRQAFNEYFGLDGRFWKSLRLLIFQPGRLTKEYFSGRRSPYLAPLRLYLSATVLFFFLLTVLDPVGAIDTRLGGVWRDSTLTATERVSDLRAEVDNARQRVSSAQEVADSVSAALDSLRALVRLDSLSLAPDSARQVELGAKISDGVKVLRNARLQVQSAQRSANRTVPRNEWQLDVLATYPADSTIRAFDLDEASEFIFPRIVGRSINLPEAVQSSALKSLADSRTTAEDRHAMLALGRNAISRLPVVVILMLPIFALLLKMVYRRRDWYYSEHLIFALHNHALAFVAAALMAVFVGFSGGAPWSILVACVLIVLSLLYFFVAQKVVYGQGLVKTFFKFSLVLTTYTLAALILGSLFVILFAATLG
jgi:hypothetical protein